MKRAPARRRWGWLAAVLIAASWMCPLASAINKPEVSAGAAPPNGAPGPVQPMEKNGDCGSSGVIPGTDPSVATPNQRMMDLSATWRSSRGDGQLVAVLDTGVRPGPRLPGVQPGGDYVESTDGLTDCDGHGTLVAGLIAG
ncbi:MAG: type VII secretion-associated serine protease, partial [Mycobacterium sp.]|nr:type VII secretion-associated serine protease [Mycobacterium sp.]